MDSFPLLSLIVFAPTIGALLIFLLPSLRPEQTRLVAIATAAVTFLLSLGMLFGFDQNADFQFRETVEWLPSLGASYALGVDGIALILVLLTTLISLIAIGWSWDTVATRHREFFLSLLLLETGILGVFVSLDLFVFYIFWEIMLIPTALLIGIWGGHRRVYASLKFFLYTLFSSLLMLAGIVATYQAYFNQTGVRTLNILDLQNGTYSDTFQNWAFAAFFIAFAVKVPIWPFHTWQADAYQAAPTASVVMLSAVMSKMGVYGLIRYNLPLFERGADWWAPAVIVLSIIGILYGALVALVQTDMKRLLAFSSLSHMGFATLGLFVFNTQGFQGSILVMVAHGLNSGALFLLVGVLAQRANSTEIRSYSGVASRMPAFGGYFTLFMFASIGLPGLSAFIGEFLVALGTWDWNPWAATFTFAVVIFSAWYMIWMFQRIVFGRAPGQAPDAHDGELTPQERRIVSEVTAETHGGQGGLPNVAMPLISGGSPANRQASTLAGMDEPAELAELPDSLEVTGEPIYPDQRELVGAGRRWRDISLKEGLTIAPLAVLTLVVGVYPAPIFDIVGPAVERILATLP
jgi:NADH-quinone oxidoreductase subunit M